VFVTLPYTLGGLFSRRVIPVTQDCARLVKAWVPYMGDPHTGTPSFRKPSTREDRRGAIEML
jgi:hypothetical protein